MGKRVSAFTTFHIGADGTIDVQHDLADIATLTRQIGGGSGGAHRVPPGT